MAVVSKTRTGRYEKLQEDADPYDHVRVFAKKFDITPAQAKRLIKLHGKDSSILVREAWKLKR
jgi:hypothetical protein